MGVERTAQGETFAQSTLRTLRALMALPPSAIKNQEMLRWTEVAAVVVGSNCIESPETLIAKLAALTGEIPEAQTSSKGAALHQVI